MILYRIAMKVLASISQGDLPHLPIARLMFNRYPQRPPEQSSHSISESERMN